MRKCPIYVPPEGPPQGILPNPEIYALMGEENIYKMIEAFYAELALSTIKEMFEVDFLPAAHRTAAFFVFILGGPPLYQQKYGAPMMRKRHLPFEITDKARQVWLDCFEKILSSAEKNYSFPMQHYQSFWDYLVKFSAWMVNSK